MQSIGEGLAGLSGLVAARLPAAPEAGALSDSELTASLTAIGETRRVLDASAAVLAAEVARRSARQLGTEGLAQGRGHKDGAGLVEELTGVGRGEAVKLIRIGGLLETAEAVAPAAATGLLDGNGGDGSGGDLDGGDVNGGEDNGGEGNGRSGEGETGGGGDPDGESAGAGAGGAAGRRGGVVPVAPPPRDLEVLKVVPGPWDAPVAVALRNGWLSAAHSDALRHGLSEPRGGQFEDDWRQAVVDLIGDCWTAQWNPEDLGRAAKRMRAALDGVAAQAEAHARYEQRSLKRVVRASGMVHYDLDLDPESDARFYGPIKRLLSPRFGGPRFTAADDVQVAGELERDPRSNEQLQVDTLLDLIDRAVARDANDLFKNGDPQVMVAVTTSELEKARAAQSVLDRHHGGDHGACSRVLVSREPGAFTVTARVRGACPGPDTGVARGACPGPDTGVAWIDGRDEPITATDALRMICAGGFTPVLFDESGQAIDVGSDRRLFTRTQRRALAKRDGGCLYPGCDRPPEDCEAHHINPWAQHPSHRKSEVRDGVLLCRRHHKLLHDHGARIRREENNQYWLHWPGRESALLHSKAGLQTQLRLAERRRVAAPRTRRPAARWAARHELNAAAHAAVPRLQRA